MKGACIEKLLSLETFVYISDTEKGAVQTYSKNKTKHHRDKLEVNLVALRSNKTQYFFSNNTWEIQQLRITPSQSTTGYMW